jgi:superkiller protein 3
VAQYHLGKRYYTSRRFADARIAYETAIRSDPGWARAHLGLGLSLYEEGATARAREELERALSLDPSLAWAEFMLGKIEWSGGSVNEALPHVRRATELDPRSAEAWYGLGVCYTQQRDYPHAIEALRKAVARQNGSARYHTALGELLAYRGQADEGVKEYERALQLDPQFGPVCALMGRYLLQNAPGNEALDRAEDLLQRAAKLPTLRPAEIHFNLGQLYVRKGDYDKAVEALKASLALEPRDERTFYALANAYRRLGRAKEAGETEARFRQISALHVQQQGLEARVRHNPDDPSLHLRLARLYGGLGLNDKAAEQYSVCLQLKPGDTEATQELEAMARAQAPPARSDFDLNLPAQ